MNPTETRILWRPTFIVGSGRSGTTLLQTMLGRHSQVAAPPETHLFSKSFSRRYQRRGDERFAIPVLARAMLGNPNCAPLFGAVRTVMHRLAERQQKELPWPDFVLEVLQCYAKDRGKRVWVEKTPHHLWYWRGIRRSFSNARFILVVRDGRDVACSMRHVPWAADDMFANAFRWLIEARIGRGLMQHLGSGSVLLVRYEDLVRSPATRLKGVCTYLDIGFEASMLQPSPDEPAPVHVAELDWKAAASEPLFTSSVGRHRDELDSAELEALNALLYSMLRHFGYAHEEVRPDLWTKALGLARGARAFLTEVVRKWLHRRDVKRAPEL